MLPENATSVPDVAALGGADAPVDPRLRTHLRRVEVGDNHGLGVAEQGGDIFAGSVRRSAPISGRWFGVELTHC